MRRSKLATGHDLYSIEALSIPANNRALIRTGLAIALPQVTYGRIAPRSSLATKLITVDAGVVDEDYGGELKVLLVNNSKMDYKVQKGDHIAQLIVERKDNQEWQEVEDLEETERAKKDLVVLV